MYYINYFFIFSIIGHFIETVFVSNFTSGILYGWWTPVYGFGVILILLINKLIKRITLKRKLLFKILITYITAMIILSLIEALGGYIIKFIFDTELWNYEKHKFNIGPYISLETANMWGIASILVIYVLKPIFDKIEKLIPKYLTYSLILLFIGDIVLTLFLK